MSDEELQGRLSFMKMDAAAIGRVRAAKDVVMRSLPGALDEFYKQVSAFPETRKFFGSPEHMSGAKSRQINHWERISDGRFDEGYVRAVNTVGEVHAKIGLEPRWYIGGYALVLENLMAQLVKERWPRTQPSRSLLGRTRAAEASDKGEALAAELGALAKAALLDMDFAISIYLDAAEKARLRAEAETLANERSRVVKTVGEAMSEIAAGNLTFRMPDDLPPEYSKLRDDFNAAIGAMEQTMGAVLQAAAAIRSSAAEVSHASNSLAEQTGEQSSALQAAAATTEELAASVKTNAEASRRTEMVAGQAQGVAENGGGIVRQAVEAMSRIEEASHKISDITTVIEGIAFQTNLLALNAAVEAARAGDAGKGFAVVASEVRTLAQRSAEASKDISQLIAASDLQVVQGVEHVRSAGQVLADIVAASRKVSDAVAEISSASAEQANGIEDMSNTVANMDGATQQNAALAEQSASAAMALTEQVRQLNAAVGAFQISMTGAPATAARALATSPIPAQPARLQKFAQAAVARSGAQPRLAAAGATRADDWNEF